MKISVLKGRIKYTKFLHPQTSEHIFLQLLYLQEANCTELLSHSVSMNPRASRGVAAFFRDAHKANAVVVLDGADILLSNSAG